MWNFIGLFFPKYSTFYYMFNKTKDGWEVSNNENIDESSLFFRRIKGGLFILVGLFFLFGAISK
ncbi:hypothetical protein DVH26_10075 [Paenibacillus sp. H1-7]|nr:hypothetical protein DVH26_10075 [Paenibacillus sp. H1-7]